MGILCALPRTKNVKVFSLGMTDRYSKMTGALPTSRTITMHVSTVFLDYWTVPHSIPDHLPTKTVVNLWASTSKQYAASLDWRNWQQTHTIPRRLGRSIGTTWPQSRAYDHMSPKTRKTGIYSSNSWRACTIYKFIDPQVCSHSVWYCRDNCMERQHSDFCRRSPRIYLGTFHPKYCVAASWREWQLWKNFLTNYCLLRKSDTSTNTASAYAEHYYSKKTGSYMSSDHSLRSARTKQNRRIDQHTTSWCQRQMDDFPLLPSSGIRCPSVKVARTKYLSIGQRPHLSKTRTLVEAKIKTLSKVRNQSTITNREHPKAK